MDLVLWMAYGFGTFYFTGDLIGLKNQDLKAFALVGLSLGCLREYTGRSIIELLLRRR
jgi:hypothetical protein